MSLNIKYLLFDMDGLLTDSERVTFEIWKKIFRSHGHELTLDFYIKVIGMVDSEIHEFIDSNFPGIESETMIYPIWDAEYETLAPSGGVPLKTGVKEILDYCDRKGLRRSVVSSNLQYWIETILRADGVLDRFDHIVHGGMVTRGKPDPEPFLRSMELFDALPEECLVLEDSNSGILAGSRAGMHVICIPDLRHPSPEAEACCDAVLPSLTDVITWLESNNKPLSEEL